MPSPRTKENQGGVLASPSDSARLWREEDDSSKLREPKETQPSLKEPRTKQKARRARTEAGGQSLGVEECM